MYRPVFKDGLVYRPVFKDGLTVDGAHHAIRTANLLRLLSDTHTLVSLYLLNTKEIPRELSRIHAPTVWRGGNVGNENLCISLLQFFFFSILSSRHFSGML